MINIYEPTGVAHRDSGPYRDYQLDTFGMTLQELIDNANIEEVDQDGGTLAYRPLEEYSTEIYDAAINVIKQYTLPQWRL